MACLFSKDKNIIAKAFAYMFVLDQFYVAITLKKEFERTFKNPPSETGSIGFVGTAVEIRGKSVATQIINYIISNTIYREYLIEEVADTNTPAMNLYKKLGFREYKRIPILHKRAEKIGINNFIALKYIVMNLFL